MFYNENISNPRTIFTHWLDTYLYDLNSGIVCVYLLQGPLGITGSPGFPGAPGVKVSK